MPITPTRAVRFSIFWRRRSFVDIRILSLVKVTDGADHFVLLCARELGKDGYRDHFASGSFGFRQRSFLVSEIREARLEVQRQRIVDRVANLLRAQMRLELVAPLDAQRVLVEDRNVIRIDERRRYLRYPGEPLVVVPCVVAPLLAPLLEMAELGMQDRGLERIEPTVVPDFL